MSRLICEKCEKELDPKTIVANNVYSCQKCGLVEAIQSKNNSINEVNKEDLSKYYLNEEQTVFLSLSEGTAVMEGNGKINKQLWKDFKEELGLRKYNIEIKENIQLPDDCSSIFRDFEKEINIDQNIDTSNITNMRSMFNEANLANPNTSGWNTSNVTDMSYMFHGANSANPDTNNWDVSNVKNMNFMFADSLFCGDISEWNVEKVETMTGIFLNKYFYGDISNWKPYSLGKIKVENIIKNKNYKVPYWMEYEKKEERLIAIEKYILEKELNKEKVEIKQKVKVKVKV